MATLFLQASSITIVGAMGLVSGSLITLEQGYFIMLGATLGTTVKIWVLAENIRNSALILISLSSIALLISRKPVFRDFWEILLAIGLVFFVFNMMVITFLPLCKNPTFIHSLEIYDGARFSSQFLGILTGCLLAVLVQSSSILVLLVISLAQQGVIPFTAGAALILGANIGTTSTALLVSLDHGSDVKRLAIGHFMVKGLGVCMALLSFPYFLLLVDAIVPGTPQRHIDYHLAGVHTIFNVFNIVFWGVFSSFMLKFINFIIPSEGFAKASTLPDIVRKMIVGSPEILLHEVKIQRKNLETVSQKITDYCFELLALGAPTKCNILKFMQTDFENIRDCLQELLIKVSKHQLSEEKISYVREELKFLTECTNLYRHTSSLALHLERGLSLDHYIFPPDIQQEWQNLQRYFKQLWIMVFLKNSEELALMPKSYDRENALYGMEELEKWYFLSFAKNRTLKYEYLAWVYDSLIYFQQIEKQLFVLAIETK